MYTELFEECMPIILKHEGGYVDDPDDLGGETKYGICERYFPDLDIKNLTIEQAKQIYWESYWLPMKLDQINNRLLVLHIFDHGVNAGIRTSIRMIQYVVNAYVDGYIGPQTIKAINEYEGDIVTNFINKRINYYNEIVAKRPLNQKFLKGWLNRVANTTFEHNK